MERTSRGLRLLMATAAAPLPVLGAANLNRLAETGSLEPFGDNAIMYFLLFLLFASAATPAFCFASWRRPSAGAVLEAFRYALICGAGAACFLTLLDAADDYFTADGIGWFLPLAGVSLGAAFGALISPMIRDWDRTTV